MDDFREITTFRNISLDRKRMDYYTHYFHEYYQDHFRSNQGTEVILEVLKQFGKSGIWLDIGAGPATLFWSLMLSNIKELHCTEMYIEGLKVLHDFVHSDFVPQCYQDVMDMYQIPSEHLLSMRTIPHRYFLFDALKPWPGQIRKGTYDMLTAFGVFGLCKSAEAYKRSFRYMKPFLTSNGIAIGANWMRSQHFIDQNNFDNRYLRPNLVQNAAKEYGYDILHLSQEYIHEDLNYDSVIAWVIRKK